MNEKTLPTVIPEHESGVKTDFFESVECEDEEEASQLFEISKQRLFNVNDWHTLCGAVTAVFKLTDEAGNEIRNTPRKGYFFKIDIPGPGSSTGDGFDWVEIEEIKETSDAAPDQIVAIKVRPAGNPKNDKTDTAHFFSNEASSSFIVKRSGKHVTAEVHGRNEKPNTKADAIIDKTRNALVATGAVAGFSAAQWKSLVKGLLGKNQ